jgi:general secretion pathway protein B
MSYILDALKKSEQERGHGSAPSVQTLHSSGLNYHSNKTPLWPYFLLAAIVVNLAALFYFIITKTDIEATAQEQKYIQEQRQVTETKPVISGTTQTGMDDHVPAAAHASDQAESIVYKPVFMPETARKTAIASPQSAAVETRQPPNTRNTVVEMDELPYDVLQQIPVLEFSAHVYSSNPLQRSIVINGRFMEEGERLAGDLFLNEITPDGAIFDFQGQLFHQGVVSAWN